MEKTVEVEKKIITHEHEFYCDRCGEHIGTSQEYPDGFYHHIGEYELLFKIGNQKYILHKTFCPDCAEKYENELIQTLINFDFEKSKW